MIHISDLSWLKRFNNPNEYTRVGNNIDVIIMNIDKDGRKLQLGHKQIEEDPWNSLEAVFAVGSEQEGTVIKKDDKGAIVQLPYGLEGFVPARHLLKEDGKSISADEIAKFIVIEFDRNDKRIVISHTRVWEQVKEVEKQSVMKEKKVEAESTKKAVKNIQSKVEKSTLGDLGVLADLKAKMEGDAAATAVTKPVEEVSTAPAKTEKQTTTVVAKKADNTPESEIKKEKEDESPVAKKEETAPKKEKKTAPAEPKKVDEPTPVVSAKEEKAPAVTDKKEEETPIIGEKKKEETPESGISEGKGE